MEMWSLLLAVAIAAQFGSSQAQVDEVADFYAISGASGAFVDHGWHDELLTPFTTGSRYRRCQGVRHWRIHKLEYPRSQLHQS
jgi:hypothetical protein